MPEPLTMNGVIHAAVRRDLERLHAALGTARDGDRGRAEDLRRAYAFLHGQLTHHHEQEDAIVFPALERVGVDTGLIHQMDDEHQAMSDALAATAAAMDRYASSATESAAGEARASVDETRAVVERHLAHEEGELEPLMAPHLESEEWKAAEKKLRKEPPKVAGVFFAWVTDGMDPASETYLKATVPAPVVAIFSKVLGRRYHREIAPVWRAS